MLSSCSTRESLTCSLLLSLRLRSRLSTINGSASSTSLNKEISRKLPWSQEFLKTHRLELSGAQWSPANVGSRGRPPFAEISATGIQNMFKSIHLVLFVPVAATPFAFLLAQRSSRARLSKQCLLIRHFVINGKAPRYRTRAEHRHGPSTQDCMESSWLSPGQP